MKKVGFIIGSIEIVLGLISLLITSITVQIIPKIARMCFMFSLGSFSESDYIINIGFANIISICLCLIGIITIVYFVFIRKEQ